MREQVKQNFNNLADGTNLIPPSAPLLYKDFETDLAAAHLRWIFTVADKLPNTLILICKYYYAYLIIRDIYERNPITNQPVFTPTLDAIADVITDYHLFSTSFSIPIPGSRRRPQAPIPNLPEQQQQQPQEQEQQQQQQPQPPAHDEAYHQCFPPTGPPRRFEMPR